MTEEEHEEHKRKSRENYKKNKERIAKNTHKYYINHIEERREYGRVWLLKNRENKNALKREYNKTHKEEGKLYQRAYINGIRESIYKILKPECAICGNEDKRFLTIDHIKNNGCEDRKEKGGHNGVIRYLKKTNFPEDYIKENYQILCWNHNSAKCREYLDKSYSDQTIQQRKLVKLWKEAFSFFGPCEICGETDLKFLTIDHINNDGAERRRNGEVFGIQLIRSFRKMGWPNSLRKDYRLLCFNHNCCRNREYLNDVA